jgi:hypothetical protein
VANKKLKTDKFVVYVLPASTSEPLIKIFKCDDRGEISTELILGGLPIEDYGKVGKVIIDNSKNARF